MSRVPSFLLRGYTPQVVAEWIFVQVASLEFMGIAGSNGPASAVLYLRYLNFNPFAVRVEFVSIDLAVGNNPIADLQRRDVRQLGPRQAVPPIRYGQSAIGDQHVCFELKIEASRAAWLKQQLASPTGRSLGVNVTLSVSGRGPTGEWNRDRLQIYFRGETVAGLR